MRVSVRERTVARTLAEQPVDRGLLAFGRPDRDRKRARAEGANVVTVSADRQATTRWSVILRSFAVAARGPMTRPAMVTRPAPGVTRVTIIRRASFSASDRSAPTTATSGTTSSARSRAGGRGAVAANRPSAPTTADATAFAAVPKKSWTFCPA